MENLPDDYFVTKSQFTKMTHRDVYPAIDPTAASNSQAGKVIVVTGASKGIGRLVSCTNSSFLDICDPTELSVANLQRDSSNHLPKPGPRGS